jgi:hypothetical protein
MGRAFSGEPSERSEPASRGEAGSGWRQAISASRDPSLGGDDMTRTTNARVAGITFLFYIAVAFPRHPQSSSEEVVLVADE